MKKILKKTGKYFLITIVGVLLTVNAFILLSGRLYIYKGVLNTYFVGRMGPSIYDKDVFSNATISAENGTATIEHKQINKQKIPKDYRKYMEDLDTRAFMVFHGDTLLYEEYWDGHDQQSVSNSFSVAKTVVALLVGIAIEEGKIKNLEESIANYLPEFKGKDTEKVSIRDLLTMSSGLSWTESGSNPLSDNAESYYGWDLRNQTMRQTLIDEPGKVFRYQSGNSQLLAFIVEKATGRDLAEYAEEKIWKKIGAKHDAFWSLDDESGDEKAFCCMYATARDFAKIGQLLLNKGKVGEEQIIPEWYYAEMIRPANLVTEDGSTNRQYGLHLWTYFGGTNPVYYCRGILGQYIITIPSENILIVRLGMSRAPKFEIPDHLKKDKKYCEENEKFVGHGLDLFQYISLAKMIKSQTSN